VKVGSKGNAGNCSLADGVNDRLVRRGDTSCS